MATTMSEGSARAAACSRVALVVAPVAGRGCDEDIGAGTEQCRFAVGPYRTLAGSQVLVERNLLPSASTSPCRQRRIGSPPAGSTRTTSAPACAVAGRPRTRPGCRSTCRGRVGRGGWPSAPDASDAVERPARRSPRRKVGDRPVADDQRPPVAVRSKMALANVGWRNVKPASSSRCGTPRAAGQRERGVAAHGERAEPDEEARRRRRPRPVQRGPQRRHHFPVLDRGRCGDVHDTVERRLLDEEPQHAGSSRRHAASSPTVRPNRCARRDRRV